MKYTKKVPYFKEGDKFDKAFKKLPKEQKEVILKINSAQKEQERKDKLSSVGAGFQKPATSAINMPVDTRSAQIENTVGQTIARTRGQTFEQAFQAARERGDKEFTWNGESYHTRTAEEEAALRSGDTDVTVTNVDDINTEDKSSSVVNSNVGWGVLKLDQQQSETPDNTQKTNVTNTAEDEVTKIRDTSPYSGPSIRIDRDKVRNIPQNLRNSGEAAQQFFDGVNLIYKDFEKTTPGKIMNNPTQSQHLLGALPLMLWGKIKKRTNPMFQQGGTINKSQRKGGWLFQQGGQMPQEGSQEELVLDFAVRYLVAMGVPETEIMDPQGNLNPEYQQELEQIFNSRKISWSDYAASPDEYMQQFIGNLQAQTQMAKKGAKLKRLSQLRIYKK